MRGWTSPPSHPGSSRWRTGSSGARPPPWTAAAGRGRASSTRSGTGTAPQLTGWIATSPTPIKRTHLEAHPFASLTYWAPNHDTCTAECGAELVYDDDTRIEVWERFVSAPEPVGYDPSMIPVWTSPTAESFVAMRLTPWRLRVMPGEVMTQARADLLLTWTG